MLDVSLKTYGLINTTTAKVECLADDWWCWFYRSAFSDQWFMGSVGAIIIGRLPKTNFYTG